MKSIFNTLAKMHISVNRQKIESLFFFTQILYRCRPYGPLTLGGTVSIQMPPLMKIKYLIG